MGETQMIGKYPVQGMIAKGGMGEVYKAIHPSLKRQIVIKKFTMKSSAIGKERFKKEAQILLDMQSPYIVHLFDYFTEGSYRYIVEEYVDGMALDSIIKKETALCPQVAMLVLLDTCYALRFAHSKNVVHRDIKPGNILISKRAEIKLADFGIAADESDLDEAKTKTGVMLGTPAYMPPEQFENSSAVDQRADIYALGVMLYEMVTGTKPYPGDMSEKTFERVRKCQYVSPKKIDKNIPPVICRLIHKMLQPKAKNRFASVNPVIKIIKNYLKKYDSHAIRVELAKIVLTPKAPLDKHAVFIEKKNIWETILISLLVAGAAAWGFLFAWNGGYIHKTVLRPWFTPVTITMKMPSTTAPASDIKARAIFFSETETEIDEVKDSERVFFEGIASVKGVEVTRPASTSKDYVIKPVFLRPGKYRAKVVIGSYVCWQNFNVDSKDKVISIDFLRKASRPISLKTSVVDGLNGFDLTDKAKVTVLYDGKWIPLERLPKNKFNSANVWKFKASAEGYEDEIFSLLIDWYQDTVTIQAAMFPLSR